MDGRVVFWPADLVQQQGTLVGWKLEEKTFVLCSCLSTTTVADQESLLGKHGLQVLGNFRQDESKGTVDILGAFNRDPNGLPSHSDPALQVILFQRPKSFSLQYFSLDELNPDLAALRSVRRQPGKVQIAFMDKVQKQCVGPVDVSKSRNAIPLKQVLERINSSFTINSTIHSSHYFRRKQRDAFKQMINMVSPLVYLGCWIAFLFRLAISSVTHLLNVPVLPRRVSLSKISMMAQQLELRMQQACFWPWEYSQWLLNKNKLTPVAQAQYIGFYNFVWLVANDLIIGLALSTLLRDNSAYLVSGFSTLSKKWLVQNLVTTIHWLMGWPAGLKLNKELNLFFGEFFLWLIYIWDNCLDYLILAAPYFISAIAFLGCFGATFIISGVADGLTLITSHLHLFYTTSRKIYRWQVSVILSLFILFRGRRKNVMRNRIDSAEYDLDQLLLGALLFSVLIFLFPTVAVYYTLFSLTHVFVIIVQGGLQVALALLNHFPLFTIMLRIKDPLRVSSGLDFRIHDPNPPSILSVIEGIFKTIPAPKPDTEPDLQKRSPKRKPTLKAPTPVIEEIHSEAAHLVMSSVPISFKNTFYQYLFLWDEFTRNYLTSTNMGAILTGEIILPVKRLNYPSLPDNPTLISNISSLWTFYRKTLPEKFVDATKKN